jgi:ABC-type dipeptide/oligopeptide/nickel transport system permease component
MTQYLIRRLLQIPAVLFIVASLLFILLQLGGDPVIMYLPIGASEEQHQAMRDQLGLNDPLFVQFVRSTARLARGDFGHSFRYRRPASEVIFSRLPASLQLAGSSFLLSTGLGLLMGALCAWYADTWFSRIITRMSFTMQSLPEFWIAVLLIYWLAVRKHLLPTSGYGGVRSLILPTTALVWILFPRIYLLSRASLLEVMKQAYITTARAKGNTESRILWIHALRNALVTITPYIGLLPARLIGGAVVIEQIFAWPGIGRLAVEGVIRRDMALVHGTSLMLAGVILLSSLTVDVANAFIDPRIRVQ